MHPIVISDYWYKHKKFLVVPHPWISKTCQSEKGLRKVTFQRYCEEVFRKNRISDGYCCELLRACFNLLGYYKELISLINFIFRYLC